VQTTTSHLVAGRQTVARARERGTLTPPDDCAVAIGIASSRRVDTIALRECDRWDALLGRADSRIARRIHRCHARVDTDAVSPQQLRKSGIVRRGSARRLHMHGVALVIQTALVLLVPNRNAIGDCHIAPATQEPWADVESTLLIVAGVRSVSGSRVRFRR
jgi:hypothetical protein